MFDSLVMLAFSSTYNAHQESAIEEGTHATDEGNEEYERASRHSKVATVIVALNGQVLRIDPEARVAPDP